MAKIKKTGIYPLVLPSLFDRLTITDVSNFEKTRSIRLIDIINLLNPDGGNIVLDTIFSGDVYWTGVELKFRSTIIRYAISSVEYEAPAVNLLLEDAHPTLNRIDVFAVNNQNEIVVITGIPAINPQEKNVEFGTQLRVSSAYIPAGSEVPQGAIIETVYNENVGQPNEWDTSLGVGTIPQVIILDSSNDPSLDSVSIEASNITDFNSFLFSRNSSIDLIGFSSFAFEIKTKSVKEYAVKIQFLNQGNDVGEVIVGSGEYGFNPLDTSEYQTINIPNTSIAFTDTEIDQIVVSIVTSVPLDSVAGFFIDNLRIIYLENNQILNTTYLALLDSFDTSYFNKSKYAPLVTEDEDGLKLERIPLFEDIYLQNAIINGGVVHISGLTYNVWATAYIVNGISYFDQAISQNVTLSAADVTNPRIDVFAIFNNGNGSSGAVAIEGTAEQNPVKPNLDLINQAEVGFKILFPGEIDDNNVNTNIIYDENVGQPNEWTNTTIPASSDPAYTIDPNNGSICYDVGIDAAVRTITFQSPIDIQYTQSGNLVFSFKTLGSWARAERISIRISRNNAVFSDWININTDNSLAFNLDLSGTNSDWQIVAIPFTQFNIVPLIDFDTIEIQFDTQNRVLLDHIRYQTGVINPNPGTTVQVDPYTIYIGNINETSSSNIAQHINQRSGEISIDTNKIYFLQAIVDGFLTTYSYHGAKPVIFGSARTQANMADFKYMTHSPIKVTGGQILKGGSNQNLSDIESGDIAHILNISNAGDPLTLLGQEFQSNDPQLRTNWLQKQTIDI